MSIGSLMIRGWSLLIVGALVSVSTNPLYARFGWLALFMAICFWIIDAHFVRQVRLFRKIDQRAKHVADSEIDFSLDTSVVDSEADAVRSVMFTGVPCAFYMTVITLTLATRAFLHFHV